MNTSAETLKKNAAARLSHIRSQNALNGGKVRRSACAPNRAAKARLDARVKDWDATVNDPTNRNKNMAGFNKPGSMKGAH